MKILVLCTGNSARSILLESTLNHHSNGRITAYSAGSKPSGIVHPAAITLLKSLDFPIKHLRSKSWNEFEGEAAEKADLVITVCGNARDETCPIWQGSPMRAHWGVEDPALITHPPEAVRSAFATAYEILSLRAHALLALQFEDMAMDELHQQLSRIGEMTP
jgi:protein-tyrosine-phosphatase